MSSNENQTRKKSEFDDAEWPERVTQLAEWGCTNEEIAEDGKMTVEELERQHAGLLRLGRLRRCLTVRKQMYRLVKENKNPPCTRFLYEELPSTAEEQDVAEAKEDAEFEAMSEEELEQEIQRLEKEEAAAAARQDLTAQEGQGGIAGKTDRQGQPGRFCP